MLPRISKFANPRLCADTSFDREPEGSQIMTTPSGKIALVTGASCGTGRTDAADRGWYAAYWLILNRPKRPSFALGPVAMRVAVGIPILMAPHLA
jgi:hypothetical protein